MIVLNTTSSFDGSGKGLTDLLAGRGYALVKNPHKRKLTEAEAIALIGEHRPVGLLAGTEPLTRKVMEAALPELKVISRVGTGTDQVDLGAAKELGIAVCNTPDAPTDAVKEITIGLMLAVLRKIPLADRTLRQGKWGAMMGGLLGARTVGIIGMGRIGRAVGKALSLGFACPVIGYDPFLKDVSGFGFECRMADNLDGLLVEADIVSLHIPGGGGAERLLGAREMGLMKKGSIIINAARGGLVDEVALKDALDSGQLAGAGLDVYETEPYKGPLANSDSAVLTMHMGSYANEAREKMESDAVANLLSALLKREG